MALHPADDGKLAVDGSRRPTPSPRLLAVLAAVFAVVVVASLGLLAYGLLAESDPAATGSAGDDPAAREAVMSQADQFVLRANTYGPGDLDEDNALPEYAEQVREVITPKFAVAFDSSLTLAEQTVAEAGYARDVDLYATGVESIDADSATVLVAGVFSGSYPDSSAEAEDGDRIEFEPQPFRFTVNLVKIDDAWLVDDFAPLSSEVVDPLDPSAEPAPDPTGQPDPSGQTDPTGQPQSSGDAPDLQPQQPAPSSGPAS